MSSVRLNRTVRVAAPLYLSVLAGFVLGFESAWLLMKFTWLDMRVPGEAAIPAGILLGLGGGLWCLIRPLRPVILSSVFWLAMMGALPLLYAAASAPRAFWYTAPVLFRHGLGLPPIPAPAFWTLLSMALFLGLMLHLRLSRFHRQEVQERNPE